METPATANIIRGLSLIKVREKTINGQWIQYKEYEILPKYLHNWLLKKSVLSAKMNRETQSKKLELY